MNDPVDPTKQAGQTGFTGQSDQSQFQGQPTPPPPPPNQAPPPAQSPTPPPVQPSVAGASPPGQPMGNNLSGIMDENVDVSNLVANAGQNQQDSAFLFQMPIAPHPNTTFDERKFIELLAGSISLTVNEKRKIVEAIPQLSQYQIDELIKIFEEEKGKFAELEQKHSESIAELEAKHGSMVDVQAQQEEAAQKSAEEEEAERIKRELGLAGGGFGATMFQLQFVINGQVYGQAEVPQDISAAEAIAKAKADPTVAQVLAGYQITEEAYIPGQSVNFVVQ